MTAATTKERELTPSEMTINAYVLPRDPLGLYKRVFAIIPDDWSRIEGELRAPQALVAAKMVTPGAVFMLDDKTKLLSERKDVDPTYDVLHEMITTPRIPEVVQFKHAGLSGKPFAFAKMVALYYLFQGFKGRIDLHGSILIRIVHGDPVPHIYVHGRNGHNVPIRRTCRHLKELPLSRIPGRPA